MQIHFQLIFYSIGKSKGNRELWVLKIGSSNAEESSLPAVRLVAGLNGFEPVATEILLQFAVELVTLYGKDTAITNVSSILNMFHCTYL